MSDPTYDRDAILQRIADARTTLDQQHEEPEPEPLTEIGDRMYGRGRGTDSLAQIADRIFRY